MSLLLWDELAALWQAGDFRGVHDWLNERWARSMQESVQGADDPFVQFLQGLAFTALAFHFAGERNFESAGIFTEDGLIVLSRYAPVYAGIEVTPLIDALAELRDTMPAPDTEMHLPPVFSGIRALRFSSLRAY